MSPGHTVAIVTISHSDSHAIQLIKEQFHKNEKHKEWPCSCRFHPQLARCVIQELSMQIAERVETGPLLKSFGVFTCACSGVKV